MVLLSGFGALSLIHRNLHAIAEQLIAHLHLNPAKHYPRIFLDAADQMTDPRLWMLAILAMAYALMRFVEAYGLWRGRRWAEWFAAISGAIYVPFELYELATEVTLLAAMALVVNLLIVAFMILTLKTVKPE